VNLAEFDYDLPPRLIAQHPLPERGGSRLLFLDGRSGETRDANFRDLPDLVRPDDVIVFNDTRVMRARLFGAKESGGKVEVLIERVLNEREALALVSTNHPPRPGTSLLLDGELAVEVIARRDEFFELRFQRNILAALERHGHVPLPPYIERDAACDDESRYQTVYARERGAVAAPTAGLHFDEAMFETLRDKGVELAFLTLHVGAGTFQPVRTDRIEDHRMHAERYCLSESSVAAIGRARQAGGRVIAVGTTSLRALEASVRDGELRAGEGETALFITPGYRFQLVDLLLTNFHLPRSTLLILVSAFGGIENIRRAYRHAIQQGYRFFSYGDAMLIERCPVSNEI